MQGAWKAHDRACFTRTVLAYKSGVFELVDHPPSSDLAPPDHFLSPDEVLCAAEHQYESFCTTRIKVLKKKKKVWKNYSHLIRINHCIMVSLWTFQCTLVVMGTQLGRINLTGESPMGSRTGKN